MSSSSTKLVQIFEASASLRRMVTADMMLMFSVIARANERRKGIHMKEIETLLGLNSASCSRIQQSLGIRHQDKVNPGLGLIVTAPDPGDPRAKLVFITPKGRKFWAQCKSILGETDEISKTPS